MDYVQSRKEYLKEQRTASGEKIIPGFHINKISVSVRGFTRYSVDLKAGLNILCRTSNEGLNDILDYLFGGNKVPEGYDWEDAVYEMTVQTDEGFVIVKMTVNWKSRSRSIFVESTDRRIPEGPYNIEKGHPNIIEDLWLRLMGIDEPVYFNNMDGDIYRLNIRHLIYAMLIGKKRIETSDPILLYRNDRISSLSVLYTLMTGEDFLELSPRFIKAAEKAKKKAAAAYIKAELSQIEKLKAELVKPAESLSPDEIEKRIQAVSKELQISESSILSAADQSKQLLQDIMSVSNKIAECKFILERQNALKTLYDADLKRLGFIMDGDQVLANAPKLRRCPLCNNGIDVEGRPDIKAAVEAEADNTRLRINDLNNAEEELKQRLSELKERYDNLLAQHKDIEDLISAELRPNLDDLASEYKHYLSLAGREKEEALLRQREETLSEMLKDAESETTSTVSSAPDIRAFFTPDITNAIEDNLKSIIDYCKPEGIETISFDLMSFDVIINGKSKRSFNKEYRTFYNSALLFSVMKYLTEYGQYCPNLLLLDFHDLIKKDTEYDKLYSLLVSYLAEHQEYGQIILLEDQN